MDALQPVTAAWIKKIQVALEHKKEAFQLDADEAMEFYNGPYDFMYGLKHTPINKGFTYTGGAQEGPAPTFAMTLNKVAEMVQLFGPVLYHKNPVRQVNARQLPMLPLELFGNPADPKAQEAFLPLQQQVNQRRAIDEARAMLLQHYLNITPAALDLKTESRHAIDEALIKGMGCLFTELYTPPGSTMKMVGSFYGCVDDLCIDPDARNLNDAKWIARRCYHPVWEVEATYKRPLPEGWLRGNMESFNQTGQIGADPYGDTRRRQGGTNDLLVYWKIWSKMGLGAKLSGMVPGMRSELDRFGDFTYMVVTEGVPYFLNVPPEMLDSPNNDQAIATALQWPTPFWADGTWPFTPIAFHYIPNHLWPMSHLRPGLGELKFLNWAYSFLAGKIRTACKDFLVIAKSVGEDMVNTILHGSDYELIRIEAAHGTISDVVQFLQHPEFHGDIYTVLQAIESNFDKRVGLNELMYGGSSRQMRSAAEAQVKSDQLQVRPDDMANHVEDAMSEVARKEALCARWHLQPQDITPIMGELGAQWWSQLVTPSDPNEIIHQLEYRIEAGTARKPNKDRDVANLKDAMQTIAPQLWQYAMATGDVSQINALMVAWAKSLDLDPSKFLLNPPPPPVMPAPGQEGEETQEQPARTPA